MNEPLFVSIGDVFKLHDTSIKSYGGSVGVRNQGLIESALASAQNTFFYGNGDLFDIASAYAFHLAEAQAFIDGNKRTAAATALVFLEINGVACLPDKDLLYDAMIGLAEKRVDKTQLAGLFRQAAN